ncbi:hypothetical protein SAMN04489713_104309 [Actinomadura madurae]|uniref:Uncharacterized protein n=1 Tax=Actinomadura madurae TaxID=1993 RepID=A0A1I5EVK6_9ACTN|nr:hypothetical protein [Actinomadura madurae]SFO15562.1 hypothetical protein SAMN04489713_104309 [Actinomadura madurae]
MTLSRGDKEFRHPGVSYLDYKQLEMDRVLTAFLPRLWWGGKSSILSRTADLDVEDFTETFREHPESFVGFETDTTRRWLETHLLDIVNRGKPTQAVAGLRPLHGFTYRFRNARRSRAYGADEQLYEMIHHASDPRRGTRTLEHLKNFFFDGMDQRTEIPRPDADIDVETQALISLSEAVKRDITDRAASGKDRRSHPPLYPEASDVLVDDVLRLLFHRDLIPRSVLVDHLKILFAFHLALYHLRILKLLPALVGGEPGHFGRRGGSSSYSDRTRPNGGFFLDVAGIPGTSAARLAERSAAVWFGRIPDFIEATFTVKRLDDLARHLVRRGALRMPDRGFFLVGELLRLLGPEHREERDRFAGGRLAVIEGTRTSDADTDREIEQILQLGLDDFTAYIQIITAYRVGFHRKYLTGCLDSLLLKKRPGALIAQPRGGDRRFVLDSRLLEVLLQLSLLKQGDDGEYYTAALRVDEFLDILRERYGLYIDRLPAGDGFARSTIDQQAAFRANVGAFTARLREIGFYSDLSDAYLTQTITPRYTVGGPDRPPAPAHRHSTDELRSAERSGGRA